MIIITLLAQEILIKSREVSGLYSESIGRFIFLLLSWLEFKLSSLCVIIDIFLRALVALVLNFFHSFFPATGGDCGVFGLCEECVSSVWVFFPLPPVYTSNTMPWGA